MLAPSHTTGQKQSQSAAPHSESDRAIVNNAHRPAIARGFATGSFMGNHARLRTRTMPAAPEIALRAPSRPVSRKCAACEREAAPSNKPVHAHADPSGGEAPVGLQAKLKIGAVNDPLEHEADRVADHVMRMPAPDSAPQVALRAPSRQASRKCAACEEEEKLQRSPAEPGVEWDGNEAYPEVHEVLKTPGRPLDAASLRFYESRFGRDFGGVRIHDDPRASAAAAGVKALAYTVDRHIVFGAGQFQPDTSSGRRLLAHELTHVVQQSQPPSLRGRAAAFPSAARGSSQTARRAADEDAASATPEETQIGVAAGGGAVKPEITSDDAETVQRQPANPGQMISREEENRASLTSPGQAALRSNPPPPAISLFNFGHDHDELKEEHQVILRNLAAFLRLLNVPVRVSLVGRASSPGSESHNLDLSRGRAERVEKFLRDNGITNVQVGYVGESNPVGDNDTLQGRSQNRAVDISLSITLVPQPQPPPQPQPRPQRGPELRHRIDLCDFLPCEFGPVSFDLCILVPEVCAVIIACLSDPLVCFCATFPSACVPTGPEPTQDPPRDPPCGSPSMPVTHIDYFPAPRGQGGRVKAAPLTHCPPPEGVGTKPSRRVFARERACLRATTAPEGGVERRFWRRVHVLHGPGSPATAVMNLHGKGEMRNLILGDESLNGGLRRGAEEDAVRRVWDDHRVLWYESRVAHAPTPHEFYADSITVRYGFMDPLTGVEGPPIAEPPPFTRRRPIPPCPPATPSSTPGATPTTPTPFTGAIPSGQIGFGFGGFVRSGPGSQPAVRILFRSQGVPHSSLLPVQIDGETPTEVLCHTINLEPLNIAPPGDPPIVIDPATPLHIPLEAVH
jgi:outer membrane protein OmpA-like peptidoglycan-associated protein